MDSARLYRLYVLFLLLACGLSLLFVAAYATALALQAAEHDSSQFWMLFVPATLLAVIGAIIYRSYRQQRRHGALDKLQALAAATMQTCWVLLAGTVGPATLFLSMWPDTDPGVRLVFIASGAFIMYKGARSVRPLLQALFA